MPFLTVIITIAALIVIVSGFQQLVNILVRGHAPFIFSRRRALRAIEQNILLQPQEVFYELGAGTAPLTRRLAKLYPASRFVAVEYFWPLYLLGRLLSLGQKNIAWRKADFYKIDLSAADYFYCFLNPQMMRRLATEFSTAAKNGAIVISYIFLLPNCQPSKTLAVGQGKINFYRINSLDK